ncbi:MAG TPA: hypothetical protein VFZ21_21485, partial [Gemmatimonadaceae bacterium]|nr:hypothetical protein [Gemmatimonadaceae bacterium]
HPILRPSTPESASRPVEVGKGRSRMDRMNRMTKMTHAAAALLSQAAERKRGTAARDATIDERSSHHF